MPPAEWDQGQQFQTWRGERRIAVVVYRKGEGSTGVGRGAQEAPRAYVAPCKVGRGELLRSRRLPGPVGVGVSTSTDPAFNYGKLLSWTFKYFAQGSCGVSMSVECLLKRVSSIECTSHCRNFPSSWIKISNAYSKGHRWEKKYGLGMFLYNKIGTK